MPSKHRYHRPRRLMAEMNVVPYIDVMLVLLIIFMVTSPMLSLTQGVEVDLPTVAVDGEAAESEVTPVVISVDVNGDFYLTYDTHVDEPVTLDILGPRVVALLRDPRRTVLVRGDASVSHGRVVELMALLQDLGVGKVGVMTRKPPIEEP